MVVDVGGGSTELVLGDRDTVRAGYSMDIGSVRLTERHLHDDPPTAAQIAAAEADIRAALAAGRGGGAGQRGPQPDRRLRLGHHRGRARARPGPSTTRTGSTTPASRPPTSARSPPTCCGSTRAQRAEHTVINAGRVDVIAAGALILREVVDAVGVTELVASEYDILDGLARSVRERGTAWSHPGAPAGGAGTGNAGAAGRPKVEMAPDGAAWTRPDPR